MSPIEREKRFNMLLSDDENRMLRELAEANGVSASDYLRLLLRKEHARASVASADKTGDRRKPKR